MATFDEVIERLPEGLGSEVEELVLAALLGDDALAAHLAGDPLPAVPPSDDGPGTGASAFLRSVTVTGFRGIGPEASIEFNPGPGLTVVVGRNGSGKSSFADALEVALTGDSYRWKDKTKVWRDGWRNLHHPYGARVRAVFTVDGVAGDTVLERTWDDGETDVAASTVWIQPHGRPRTDLEAFGWAEAVRLYRPLLSDAELGAVGDNPSSLFDALSAILGLDDLVAAAERLRQARLAAEQVGKDARKELKERILPALGGLDDPRADRCVAALSGKTWDLDTVAAVVTGDTVTTSEPLRELARLPGPDPAALDAAATRIERAVAALEAMAGSDPARARSIADLLATALGHHDRHGGGPCPVCGVGTLDAAWAEHARTQIAELGATAAAYDRAVTERDAAIDQARRLGDTHGRSKTSKPTSRPTPTSCGQPDCNPTPSTRTQATPPGSSAGWQAATGPGDRRADGGI